MDKIEKYRAAIKKVLEEHHEVKPINDRYESQLVFDDERGHYFLMTLGWNELKRTHGATIHIDLKGEKVWLQVDRTDFRIARQLREHGIPKEDIVLGFHAPYKRPDTGYAVA